MDPDNKFMKFMSKKIRKLNLKRDKDDRKTGRLAARQVAIEKATGEKRTKIQANVDKALAERHQAEKAADRVRAPVERLQKLILRNLLKRLKSRLNIEGSGGNDF